MFKNSTHAIQSIVPFVILWLLLACATVCTAQQAKADKSSPPPAPQYIKQIDLVHFSHTDFGFTDHPEVCHDLYRRYLDIALDAVTATADRPPESRFCWTAETTIPVDAWWKAASPQRRQQLLQAVKRGQLEVSALPLNNAPFLNAKEWHTMLHWLPEDLWKSLQPTVAIQNDVNGLPRAGAMQLLDRGIKHFFTGINEDSGGAPFRPPFAFWWKMPDGRRIFVWLNTGYGSGFNIFEPEEWRHGPVPLAADARYRLPRAGEILRTDEASLRAAHRRCLDHIRNIEKVGYRADVLTISITNQWRFDNDPPFPPMADFVAAWNRLGLKPAIKMATVSTAMRDMEKSFGDKAPEYTGEWTDWWANGAASGPHEVAASRLAKRYLAAVQSPIWGDLDDRSRATIDDLYKQLCLFDEHTWGGACSVAQPYSLDTLGQFNEKARLAYRPMAMAEWLLSQRLRSKLVGREEGFWIANPTDAKFSGWARMPATSLRENYQSLADAKTGLAIPLYREPGLSPFAPPQKPADLSREDSAATFADNAPDRTAKFWVDKLDAQSLRHYRLSTQAAPPPANAPKPDVQTDGNGWPTSAVWPGMSKPLFVAGLGDFTAIRIDGFAPRWRLREIWENSDAKNRQQMRNEKLHEVTAQTEGKAAMEETPHTLVYTQWLKHPRLNWAKRTLEVWKLEPRVRLTFRLNRISSSDPEIFYIAVPLPCDGTLPRLSNGGMSFTPFEDQLPGTCRDYFAIDGWAHYTTGDGSWLWVSRDAPLVTLGGPQPLAKLTSPPARTGLLCSMVYNNLWYTNFVGDCPGVMEFQYDLAWRHELDAADAERMADTMAAEPVSLIEPAAKEHPAYIKYLYQP